MPNAPSHVDDSTASYVFDLNLAVPPKDRQRAVRLALQERTTNSPTGDGAYSLAVARNRLWAVGRRLRVRFLDAQDYPYSQRRIDWILEAASQWTQHANLTFVSSVDNDAELRVSFSPSGGCSSYIGTDALAISSPHATINLSIFGTQTDPLDYEKYVLHEFGHAICCIHEHQTPVAGIRWNRPAVYADYARRYGWSWEMVDLNVFTIYGQGSSNHTAEMDPHSIMVYPIPAAHTMNGYSVDWNGTLSTRDIEFITTVYPGRQIR